MGLRKLAAGLALSFAGLAAPCGAAERPMVVVEAMTFESGDKIIDTAVYRPNDDGKHPAIVYLHGGGNSFEDPRMARFHAEMAKRGLVVVAPHYLVNRTGYYDWQKTATKAVTVAASLPSVDPDHIGMSGISMGGQCGLSVAARDRRVKAVAEFFTAWPGSLPDEPIAALPPVLLINGTADPVIPFDKAMVLDDILKAHHLPFERKAYEGVGHGFTTDASFKDAVVRTAVFFGGTAEVTGSKPVAASPDPTQGLLGPSDANSFDEDEFIGSGDLYAWSTRAKAAVNSKKKKRRRPVVAIPDSSRPVATPSTVAKP